MTLRNNRRLIDFESVICCMFLAMLEFFSQRFNFLFSRHRKRFFFVMRLNNVFAAIAKAYTKFEFEFHLRVTFYQLSIDFVMSIVLARWVRYANPCPVEDVSSAGEKWHKRESQFTPSVNLDIPMSIVRNLKIKTEMLWSPIIFVSAIQNEPLSLYLITGHSTSLLVVTTSLQKISTSVDGYIALNACSNGIFGVINEAWTVTSISNNLFDGLRASKC